MNSGLGGITMTKRLMHLLAIVIGVTVTVVSCVRAEDAAPARSAILFIGDGMGPQIVSIVKVYAERSLGRELNMVRLANTGVAGFMTTHSEDRLVTDSAASGTAIATGFKTNNGVVGMTSDGEEARNLFEEAVEHGKSVGVVTTTSVTDATPAVFMAHVPSRDSHFDIAKQILESNVSVVLGGGSMFFLPPERGRRPDGADLTERAKDLGFEVVFESHGLAAASGKRLLGLFAPDCIPYELLRDEARIPSLSEMMERALDILADDPDGFLLVVEGGRIDHAEHDNSIADAIADFLAFDDAVGEAMTCQGRDSSLTIIVTADHDCGGPAITGTSYAYPSYDYLDKIAEGKSQFLRWISGHHTATMVPVFAGGPGAERFGGVMDNTHLHDNLEWLLGF
jgi:alkaline phosphatase